MYFQVSIGSKTHRFWQRMKTVKVDGLTKYLECQTCQTRKVVQPDTVAVKGINFEWLGFKTLDV